MELQPILAACEMSDLDRIDLGLEGDWSHTVCTIWTRNKGWIGTKGFVGAHGVFRPCVELYFSNGWLGLHCFQRQESSYVLDEANLERIVSEVEAALRPSTNES